jgi:dihydroorotase
VWRDGHEHATSAHHHQRPAGASRQTSGAKPGVVRCENGRITALGEVIRGPDDLVIDAKGALIAPGLVDLGVFAIDKPAFHFGGITRAALMPDQGPPLDRPSACGSPRNRASPTCGSTPRRRDPRAGRSELAELALMRDAGAKAVATGRRWIADSGVMLRLLRYCAMLGIVVVTHAEDGGLPALPWPRPAKWRPGLACLRPRPRPKRWRSARDIALAELTGRGSISAKSPLRRAGAGPCRQGPRGVRYHRRGNAGALHAVGPVDRRFPHLRPAFAAAAQRR